MPTTEGNCGRGARDYGDELAVLRGVLASEHDAPVYPDDRCPDCEREGRVFGEDCWHRHWSGRRDEDAR